MTGVLHVQSPVVEPAPKITTVFSILLNFHVSGRMRGAVATLERLGQIFPEDISLKNDLGVAYLLLGDNQSAKTVYLEVSDVACFFFCSFSLSLTGAICRFWRLRPATALPRFTTASS